MEPCLPKCAGGHGQATYWTTLVLNFCNGSLEDSGAIFVKQDNISKQEIACQKVATVTLPKCVVICHFDDSISSTFVHRDMPLVIQFTVKHEQNIDCGGGYIKHFDCKFDQADMHGESPYNIMFGSGSCHLAPRRSMSALSTRARTT